MFPARCPKLPCSRNDVRKVRPKYRAYWAGIRPNCITAAAMLANARMLNAQMKAMIAQVNQGTLWNTDCSYSTGKPRSAGRYFHNSRGASAPKSRSERLAIASACAVARISVARSGIACSPAGSTSGEICSYSVGRSEEHTSELQSRENLVCRLLLEKKKKKNK